MNMNLWIARLGPLATVVVLAGIAVAIAVDDRLIGWARTLWFLALTVPFGVMTAWLSRPRSP